MHVFNRNPTGPPWDFRHHATLCIAAYVFLIAERGAFPPSGPPFPAPLSRFAIPDGYRRRGAADPTPQADIDRWSIESDAPVGRLRHLGPTVAPL